MKHEKIALHKASLLLMLVAALGLLAGCAGWSSTPNRTQANYGESVRNMVNNQIYDPEKYRHPNDLAPDGMEGIKAESVLQDAYRKTAGKPDEVRKRASVSSSGGGGASSGGVQ